MKRTIWPRTAAMTAVVASLGLALSGCVATAANIVAHAAVNANKSVSQLDRPHEAQCWRGTYKDVDGYADWGENGAASPCSAAHQLYTYAVPTLTGTYKGKLYDNDGYVDHSIEADAYDSCNGKVDDAMSNLGANVQRVVFEDYLPEEAQWNAGARWVRCDIGVLKLGSSVVHPQFENLPSITELDAQMRRPQEFDFCVDDPGGLGAGGPKGGTAVYADCLGDPDWKLYAYQDVLTGSGTKFPTPAQMKAQYESSCEGPNTDATHVTYVYYPSKSDWAHDIQQLECWVGRR